MKALLYAIALSCAVAMSAAAETPSHPAPAAHHGGADWNAHGGAMDQDIDGPPEGHGPMMQFLHEHAAELGLSEAQKTKLHAIIQRMQGRWDEERENVGKEQRKLDELMQSDSPNEHAIDEQIDQLARVRADFAKERVSAHLEMRSILNPEQRKKLQQVMEKQHGERRPAPRHPEGARKSQ